MHLRFTVIDPTGPAGAVECAVDAAVGTVLGEVRPQLLRAAGKELADDGLLFCGTDRLDDQTPLGVPPLLDGAVLTVDRPVGRTPSALLELHVSAGPDAGAVHPVGPGEHGIGRSIEAGVRIEDPDVSRLHAVLRVGPEGFTVHDLDSTNGTAVVDRPATRAGTPLACGEVLRVGATRLELVAPQPSRADCRPDGAGRLQLNRPPRLTPRAPAATVALPTPPVTRDKPRLPVIALVVPLVAGLGLVAVTGNPTYLLFVLLSPLMILGTFLSDRVGGRRSTRTQQRAYDEALADAQGQIDAALAVESIARHHAHPGAAALLQTATGPRPRLWERRPGDPDYLALRAGLADLPADVVVRSASSGEPAETPVVGPVPVVVPLGEVGVVGLAGPRDRVLAIARFLLAQVAGWHSPRHLGVTLLVDDVSLAPDWEWTRWLPHLRPAVEDTDLLVGLDASQVRSRLAELTALLDARTEQAERGRLGPSGRWDGRSVVVVLDGARALRRLTGVARLLAEGPAVGMHFLCLDEQSVALPAECRATIEVVGPTATALRVAVEDGSPVDGVVMDGVGEAWAHRFARALAPLQDATPDDVDTELPAHARLLDLLPFDATDAAALETAWRVSPRSTEVILGVGSGGDPFTIDLRTDGPHALVAGTTGAGKSELLQTLVAGLAVANRPDELAIVLIDYKGGAAFKDCARLPHTVGTVTDLDGHLTERALTSLAAELRRRELVLRDAGCKDIDDYLSSGLAGALPRLVLVVDEFATLAEELPDFVGGLVGIAQRGRSLGVHLVLATQRPSGVVSADIRANTTLRVALRVTDPGESADVVDVKDAALISRATPGRAVARVGAGNVVAFQSARVGGCGEVDAGGDPRVRALEWRGAGDPPPRPVVAPVPGPTDLARLVDATRAAAASLGVSPVDSPWLPPLPVCVTLTDLPPVAAASSLPFALLDLPGEQRRSPLVLDLEHGGHLLVAGGPRSGRSSVLRSLAGALAQRLASSEAHLYAIDGGSGGLSGLAALPHCGAVVARDQPARGDRLLTRLLDEVERRQALLAEAGFASAAEQRLAVSPDSRLPFMVLLVDGWEGVQSAYDEVDHGRPLELLARLVREGGAVGLRVVLTGDRGVLTSRIGASISDRLLLRLADPGDYGLAGVPARLVPGSMPTGRGLMAADVVEVQVALLDPDSSGPAQQAALSAIATASSLVSSSASLIDGVPPHQRPMRVEPLPTRVPVDAIRTAAKAAATGPLWALLGVGGDDLEALGVDLAADGPAFVVAGAPGSGRSTTLLTMARWFGHEGVCTVVVAPPRSPLSRLSGEPGVLGVVQHDKPELLERLVGAAGSPVVVIADDAEALHDTPVERPLCDMLKSTDRRAAAVVLAGSAMEMSGFFRGVTVEARRSRCGLLLGPVGPVDGDLFGVRVTRGGEARPGRGLLVIRGRVQPVQVALPEDP